MASTLFILFSGMCPQRGGDMKPTTRLRLPNGLTVQVVHLEGRLSLEITKFTTGKELFTLVTTCLGIREYWYFGLQYEKGPGGMRWLRPGQRVSRAVGKSGCRPLYFLVKYYPEEVTRLSDPAAIAHIYLQAKKEILSGSVFCEAETSVLLASYSLQAELGDWTQVDHGSLQLTQLLPTGVLERHPTVSARGWSASLRDWHQDHEGLTTHEARVEYLRMAQYLGGYGVSFFKAKWNDEEVWVGVHPKGISTFETTNRLIPQVCLKWSFIRLVTSSCKKFVVQPLFAGSSLGPRWVFTLPSQRSAKLLFELSVGYHHLHIRGRLLRAISLRQSGKEAQPSPDEKFKETTEELLRNDIKPKSSASSKILRKSPTIPLKSVRPIVRKHSCIYTKLPIVKEE